MDQGKNMRTISVITVLMLLYTGAALASCYGSCLEDCYAAAGERIACLIKCAFKCGKANEVSNGHDSCSYACAINQCTQFGNDVDKVDDCVNKCGNGICKN